MKNFILVLALALIQSNAYSASVSFVSDLKDPTSCTAFTETVQAQETFESEILQNPSSYILVEASGDDHGENWQNRALVTLIDTVDKEIKIFEIEDSYVELSKRKFIQPTVSLQSYYQMRSDCDTYLKISSDPTAFTLITESDGAIAFVRKNPFGVTAYFRIKNEVLSKKAFIAVSSAQK